MPETQQDLEIKLAKELRGSGIPLDKAKELLRAYRSQDPSSLESSLISIDGIPDNVKSAVWQARVDAGNGLDPDFSAISKAWESKTAPPPIESNSSGTTPYLIRKPEIDASIKYAPKKEFRIVESQAEPVTPAETPAVNIPYDKYDEEQLRSQGISPDQPKVTAKPPVVYMLPPRGINTQKTGPGAPTLTAAPEPGFLEHVKQVVLGSPGQPTALGEALGYDMRGQYDPRNTAAPFLNLTGLGPQNPQTVGQGVARGVGEFATGMTSPENLLLMLGTEGFGTLASLIGTVKASPLIEKAAVSASKYIPRAISGIFTADMLQSLYNKAPEVREAINSGNPGEVARTVTDAALTAYLAWKAGSHSLKGEPTETARPQQAPAKPLEPEPPRGPDSGAQQPTPKPAAAATPQPTPVTEQEPAPSPAPAKAPKRPKKISQKQAPATAPTVEPIAKPQVEEVKIEEAPTPPAPQEKPKTQEAPPAPGSGQSKTRSTATKPKPAPETPEAGSEGVPEPQGDVLDKYLDAYVKQSIEILDKIKDTDLHDELKSATDKILTDISEGRPVSTGDRKEFFRLKEIGSRHSGITEADPTGSITAERFGGQGAVFDKDGKKIGSFELLVGKEGNKVKFYDHSTGKAIETRQLSDGQWNDKALSRIAKDIFEPKGPTTPPPTIPTNPTPTPKPPAIPQSSQKKSKRVKSTASAAGLGVADTPVVAPPKKGAHANRVTTIVTPSGNAVARIAVTDPFKAKYGTGLAPRIYVNSKGMDLVNEIFSEAKKRSGLGRFSKIEEGTSGFSFRFDYNHDLIKKDILEKAKGIKENISPEAGALFDVMFGKEAKAYNGFTVIRTEKTPYLQQIDKLKSIWSKNPEEASDKYRMKHAQQTARHEMIHSTQLTENPEEAISEWNTSKPSIQLTEWIRTSPNFKKAQKALIKKGYSGFSMFLDQTRFASELEAHFLSGDVYSLHKYGMTPEEMADTYLEMKNILKENFGKDLYEQSTKKAAPISKRYLAEAEQRLAKKTAEPPPRAASAP